MGAVSTARAAPLASRLALMGDPWVSVFSGNSVVVTVGVGTPEDCDGLGSSVSTSVGRISVGMGKLGSGGRLPGC